VVDFVNSATLIRRIALRSWPDQLNDYLPPMRLFP